VAELSAETVEHLRVVRKVLKAYRAQMSTAIALLAQADEMLVADCPELLDVNDAQPEGGTAHGSISYAAANGRRT
jgi:hypothetical protein